MDLLTQGLLGACLAQSGAKRSDLRTATGIGFFSGLLADADVLIQSASDPLLNLEFHRHFSHSIFFVPFGALFASLLLWPFLRRKTPFRSLYLYALLGYSLSGFLDACTSYGTHWLWPFYSERIAFSIISIIDPVVTLSLLLAALFTWRSLNKRAVYVGLLLVSVYLLLGVVQHKRVTIQAQNLIASRGQQTERLLVKPTLGNLLLWRSIYRRDEHIVIDAIRIGVLGEVTLYPGTEVPLFKPGDSQLPSDSVLQADIQRFNRFSDGWLAFAPNRPGMLGDMRYAMLPNEAQPLWGIEYDRKQLDQHASYVVYRDTSQQQRQRFIDMLLGRPLSP